MVVAALIAMLRIGGNGAGGHARSSGQADATTGPGSSRELLDAMDQRRSGVMVTAMGRVTRVLSDDVDGDEHQRFIIEIEGGATLLIAHNLDLAERVPVDRGDEVTIRGQYEWNEQGGVLHWTHHDPGDRREGGWIEHEGRRYE